MKPTVAVASVADMVLRNVVNAQRLGVEVDAAARSVFLSSVSETTYVAAIDWLMAEGLIHAVLLRTPTGDCVKVEVLGATVEAGEYVAAR